MSLIFCEDGLREIKPPCVAQTFINHNARLFKLFVIKDKYNVIERPSLKNFRSGGEYFYRMVTRSVGTNFCCLQNSRQCISIAMTSRNLTRRPH